MSSLTDEELRAKLSDFGVTVGPITGQTRQVYERKLERLVNHQGTPSLPSSRRQTNRGNKGVKTPKVEGELCSLDSLSIF